MQGRLRSDASGVRTRLRLQSFRWHFKGFPDPHAHLQLATALP
ncbi:MAG: hypothetical protein ACRDP7_03815 [Trebonia sp.]